jgi:hypothetical protein
MAAGGYISRSDRGLTLAEAWNGRRWRRRTTPTPVPFDGLSDVSCVRSSFCMAVGSVPQPIAERWNGRRWRPVKTSLDSGTAAVSCVSATRCMAVGGSSAAAWNGRRWRPVRTARIRDSVFIGLSDVSCPAATRCIAVGAFETRGAHALHPLAEEWTGRRWRFLATANTGGVLAAVDCPGRFDCMAVGHTFNGRFPEFTSNLAEQWNGRTWRARTPPGPTGSSLAGVSCPRAARCMAVGSSLPWLASFEAGLAERWNGREWRRVNPAGRHVALISVSCPRPGRCIAVGRAGTLTSAELWNGSRWRLLRTRNP